MQYHTALRPYLKTRLEEIERADIVIGIPCFNNNNTITNVMRVASQGLKKYYPEARAVIIVSDGGSTDDTREHAQRAVIAPYVEKIICIYRGAPGKGTALRAIFESAIELKAEVCVVCDSDLRSITPIWIKNLIDPVITKGYDFVAPLYNRHKYDGTITNNIIYTLFMAVFGKKIRQPIGGDFGLSPEICRFYAGEDVWETDIAKFGVDIWMTVSAVTNRFNICQTRLGRKIHDAKDPSESLGPMFRQVVGTIFRLMEENEDLWLQGCRTEEVPTFGRAPGGEPEPMEIDLETLVENYRTGLKHFGPLWKTIVSPGSYHVLKSIARLRPDKFLMPLDTWVTVLYDFAVGYRSWRKDRMKLINFMTPIYYGRIASFVNETRDMTSKEADETVQQKAELFVRKRGYLIRRWKEASGLGRVRGRK
jgi:glycosyltransferase involved in cell wall biosynthesis